MKKFVLACSFGLLCIAHTASAAVVLNEIAWMGSATGSADEWIELYNNGSTTQDLTGWKITGKGGATIILLSGSVPSNAYFLIERSDDNTVPNVPADLVVSFGKGISNDGETLKLVDGGAATVDTAVGGKNWSKLGGDKVSKHTAQRTSSGWITASPTPRAENALPSLAAEVATPIAKAKNTHVVSVAHAETVLQGSNWPSESVVAPMSVKKSTSTRTLKEQLAATSSVTANVLFQRGRDSDAEKRAWGWMITAILLVIAASVIIMRANIYEPTEADKYAIIEDIIEGKDDKNDRLSDY